MNGLENKILTELKTITARLKDLQSDMNVVKEKMHKLSPDIPIGKHLPRQK